MAKTSMEQILADVLKVKREDIYSYKFVAAGNISSSPGYEAKFVGGFTRRIHGFVALEDLLTHVYSRADENRCQCTCAPNS